VCLIYFDKNLCCSMLLLKYINWENINLPNKGIYYLSQDNITRCLMKFNNLHKFKFNKENFSLIMNIKYIIDCYLRLKNNNR
jgi:hypothetical protein